MARNDDSSEQFGRIVLHSKIADSLKPGWLGTKRCSNRNLWILLEFPRQQERIKEQKQNRPRSEESRSSKMEEGSPLPSARNGREHILQVHSGRWRNKEMLRKLWGPRATLRHDFAHAPC